MKFKVFLALCTKEVVEKMKDTRLIQYNPRKTIKLKCVPYFCSSRNKVHILVS